MRLEVQWFLGHVDKVVVAKWPLTDLLDPRDDLRIWPDERQLRVQQFES